MDNLYKCTPRQVREFILDCFYAGLVPFVKSSPGMGKSSIFKGISKETRLKMIDHRVSTSAPEDFTGLPRFDENGHAHFAPFCELFPLEGQPIPDGHDGWLLFLDEFNSGTKMVQAATYKLILDRMTGQHKLHDNVAIGLAGNLATDRAIVNPLSTAMQSRVVHLEMELSYDEWLWDVALAEGYDARILAYHAFTKGQKLMDFRPDHNESTFCCPRTWEFMNDLVKDKPITDAKIPLYAGTITSGVAVEFVQFNKVTDVPTLKDVCADPHGAKVPHDSASKWFVLSSLMQGADDTNFDKLSIYISRLGLDFRILFFRSTLVSKPKLRQHPSFASAMVELQRYLNPQKLAA